MSKLLRCRFCEATFPITKSGKIPWSRLATHVAREHKKQSSTINEYAFARAAPEDLSKKVRGIGRASDSAEFRRQLGYRSGSVGAEQLNDGDDE